MVLIIAVVVRIIANPLSNVFQKQLTQRTADPLFIISVTYGFLTLIGLGFWPQLCFTGLPDAFWQSMVLVGFVATIGNVLLVKALQIGDLSVLGPINAYKSVVGLIVSVFLLHEIPNWWGLTGVVCIVVGSYIVLNSAEYSKSQTQEQLNLAVFQRPEVRLRIAALIFSAIDGALLKKAIILSTPVIAFFYWSLFGFGFTLIWMFLVMRKTVLGQIAIVVSQRYTYIALVVLVGLMQLASNFVLVSMPVGYALALFQTSALLSVLFGYQFFQEQGVLRKLIGAGIMIAGAALIILLG